MTVGSMVALAALVAGLITGGPLDLGIDTFLVRTTIYSQANICEIIVRLIS
jgi:hypothetical protein